jgi:integrase
MGAYLEQMALVQRPATTTRNEAALRELGCFLADHAPEVGCVGDLRRHHLEAYKAWLASRPLHRGVGTLDRASIRNRLTALRVFFTRLLEWQVSDAPAGPLLFDGDLPTPDRPLPRFLDDGAAAKLLVAARADPDPFVRLVVEVLARTGMRKGELVALTVDAVVQIGSAYWLRIPLGKLHNDRYIPLHPQLKALLDEWTARRPQGLRSRLLFVDQGRPITTARIDAALRKAAAAAGIGHVTAHQLRHTLATQAINRGMSLEAIAALLGHTSLAMTQVYAKLADRTVADEYFKVSEKVEALYDQPHKLPADAEGTEMARLRREMHRRMLGNGYCARPVELDCHFESICESCTFFVTTIEFRPTLERQRDDAAAKGQLGRQKIFDGLLTRLDEHAS